jgi:hypothetical protein
VAVLLLLLPCSSCWGISHDYLELRGRTSFKSPNLDKQARIQIGTKGGSWVSADWGDGALCQLTEKVGRAAERALLIFCGRRVGFSALPLGLLRCWPLLDFPVWVWVGALADLSPPRQTGDPGMANPQARPSSNQQQHEEPDCTG